MSYTPLSTTPKRQKVYTPISEQKPINNSIKSSFIDIGVPFGGTQTTTPQIISPDFVTPQKILGTLGKEIGQSISRSAASFLGSEALAPTIDPILKKIGILERTSPFFAAFTESLSDRLYGDIASDEKVGLTGETRAEEITPVGERQIGFEKILEKKKNEYDELLKTPNLTKGERMVLETLSAVIGENKSGLATFIIGSIIGGDLTSFGGSKKGVQEAIIGVHSLEDALRFGKKMNIQDDVIRFFEKELINAGNTKQADEVLSAMVKMQSTTKPISTSVTGVYKPLAETTISKVDPLTIEARKYKSAEEFVSGMEEIQKSEINIPVGYTGGKFEIGKIQEQLKQFAIKPTEIKFSDAEKVFNEAKKNGESWAKDRNFNNPSIQLEAINRATPKGIDVNAGKLDKSQLTDIWNKANKTIPITAKKRLIIQAQKPPFQYEQLDELAERMKQKDMTEQKFEKIQLELAFIEEGIETMPGKKLMKYVSRTTGELPEVTGEKTMKSLTGSGKTVRRSEFGRRGDVIIQEIFPYGETFEKSPDIADAQKAVDEYIKVRDKFREMKQSATEMRKEISAVRKGERLMSLAKQDRRMAYRAVRDAFDLSESEMAKLRQGKDIMAMEKKEFDEFIGNAERMAEQLKKTREARIQLEGTIKEKELRKWENIQETMNLPPVSKMTPEQLVQLDEVLSQYKTGDEFLTVRQLQTIGRTELVGMRTTREVTEYLAKKYGLNVGELPPLKPHKFMYDTQLARQHPLFDILVNRYNESYLKANGRIIELERQVDDLIKKARKTRPIGIGQKIAPTDKKIIEWIESSPEQKKLFEAEMTGSELEAAQKMDVVFKEYYDYLVNRSLNKKFSSRFEDKYFPHVRRGFLEAWKEDGFLKSVKEQFDQFKQEERLMTILDEKTGDILPYEKWIGFSQFRTGDLIPTQNASRAFKAYITSLEKARQWDEFIPEIMIYVHSLSPRNMTQRGLELDDSVKRFVKTWINSKKGRIKKQIFKPGGKIDWALRMGVALTRIRDLGLNIPVGIANIFGEQAGNLTMMGAKNYATGLSRLSTSKGREITAKYANFVGKSLWEKLTEASNTIGDQFLGGLFGLFGAASRRGNQVFLLGNMTEAEWKAGEISLQRLAELRKGMGKYRVVESAESVFGKSVEGAIFGQYKRWAIPILVSTKDNAIKFLKILKTKGVKEALSSPEGSELFYSVVLGLAVGGGSMGYYNELKNDKDRNFVEDIIYKSIRDSLSLIGALDPKFIGSFTAPRLSSFIVDLTESINQLLFLEETKEGELKGAGGLERTLTPVLIKSIFKEEEQKTEKGTPRTPPGLPPLPSLKSELPPLLKLPKLPTL